MQPRSNKAIEPSLDLEDLAGVRPLAHPPEELRPGERRRRLALAGGRAVGGRLGLLRGCAVLDCAIRAVDDPTAHPQPLAAGILAHSQPA
jgi:hypothetical protein